MLMFHTHAAIGTQPQQRASCMEQHLRHLHPGNIVRIASLDAQLKRYLQFAKSMSSGQGIRDAGVD